MDQLDIYSYPDDMLKMDSREHIRKILLGHDHGTFAQQNQNRKLHSNNSNLVHNISNFFIIEKPVPQVIDNLNIYTTCINGDIIIGLTFDKDDNPYDYKDIFEELLSELLNVEEYFSFEDELEIESLLLTMFIDIRRYGDEFVDNKPLIEVQYHESFIKVFLFGIDDVGKTSFVRRIKTGEFNDNYFRATRKFNIEYIPGEDKGNIIIFMIDIANQLRFEESKKEFWKIINRYDLFGIPLLILGNKGDLIQHSIEHENNDCIRLRNEIEDYFEFDKIESRDWKLILTSVKENYNVDFVMESILKMI
ncbi:MAG: ADP-ribosylation factor-like protein [Promethearchaeota archaeon]